MINTRGGDFYLATSGDHNLAIDTVDRYACPMATRGCVACGPKDSLSPVTRYLAAYYGPTGAESITSAICQGLEDQPLVLLDPPISRSDVAGLYAIYYRGAGVDLYARLQDRKIPVHGGQALSYNRARGAATGGRNSLWNRIQQHCRSIARANDLTLGDFGTRLLPLPDVRSDLGEKSLRIFYRPVWNGILNGFDSHEQGSATRPTSRSRSDAVQPGRKRTFGVCKHNSALLIAEAKAHIAGQVVSYEAAPLRRGEGATP
jgi:hypothetical protein